eukprot:scaffold64696_cov14-Prasinocladus_malaysianus.AAC.1
MFADVDCTHCQLSDTICSLPITCTCSYSWLSKFRVTGLFRTAGVSFSEIGGRTGTQANTRTRTSTGSYELPRAPDTPPADTSFRSSQTQNSTRQQQ